MDARSAQVCGESPAGLIPMTASPAPSSSPSRTDAATPRRSSVGWFGCSRVAIVPGRPSVVRKAAVTWQARATAIRSWLRMILLVAATISGVRPGASADSAACGDGPAATPSSQSRKPPTLRCETGSKAEAECVSRISRVISSVSYGTTCSVRNRLSGTSASAHWAAARSASEVAAQPASSSPDRRGVALASNSTRPSNAKLCPLTLCRKITEASLDLGDPCLLPLC